MRIVFHKIPLQLGAVLAGHELPTCDLAQSITANLELIILTRFGEHRSDPGFGCEIWDLDFELIVSAGSWEEKLRQSLLKSVLSQEQRLADTSISIAITDTQRFNALKLFPEIKKRVDIHISGIIHKTGEAFNFKTNMFLSPLSLD